MQKPFGLGAKNNELGVLRKFAFKMEKFGFPNITGSFRLERPLLDFAANGPFSESYAGGYRYSFVGSYGTNRNDTISFDASRSKEIFGKSETPQPTSLRILNICRI